jgi:hypothetical protein
MPTHLMKKTCDGHSATGAAVTKKAEVLTPVVSPGSEAIQCRELRPPLGQDGPRDGSTDSPGAAK